MSAYFRKRIKGFPKLSFLIVLMIGYCVAAPKAADASNVVSPDIEKGYVTISIGEWPPYTSLKQKHNGVVAHIISDIFDELGLEVQFQNMPWARAYEEAASGRADGTGVWMHKAEREKDFLYSDPVLKEQFVFFHLAEDPFDWQEIADLKGSILGGVRQSSYGPEMDAAIKSGFLTMSRVTHFRQNLYRLLERRIRLFPMELNVGYSTMKQYVTPEQRKLITHHPKPFLENFSYVLFPRVNADSEKLIIAFNAVLKNFRETGRYDQYFLDLKAGKYDLEAENN